MYEQDWLMRQIQMIVAVVAKMTLKKDVAAYHIADTNHLSRLDYLYKDLETLLERRAIGRAEDLLFEKAEPENPDYLILALDFYQKVNELSDDELDAADFPREEITSGLDDMLRLFGVPSLSL